MCEFEKTAAISETHAANNTNIRKQIFLIIICENDNSVSTVTIEIANLYNSFEV